MAKCSVCKTENEVKLTVVPSGLGSMAADLCRDCFSGHTCSKYSWDEHYSVEVNYD
jgi:hypothetical protein